jgi:hypothetical protein
METSASFEARSAPLPYPTVGQRLPINFPGQEARQAASGRNGLGVGFASSRDKEDF